MQTAAMKTIKTHSLKRRLRQKGAALVLMLTSLIAIMAAAGFAIDLGYAYVNKTHLQTAVDAAAIAAAASLNQTGGDTLAACEAAVMFLRGGTAISKNIENIDSYFPANSSLYQTDPALAFCRATPFTNHAYEDTAIPLKISFAPSYMTLKENTVHPAGDYRFVRIYVENISWSTALIATVGLNELAVGASAVSGPSPALTDNICDNIVPMMLCADTSDTDISDGTIYGYALNEQHSIKISPGSPSDVGPGNFHLIELVSDETTNSGKQQVREYLGGTFDNCLQVSDPADPTSYIQTETGNAAGPTSQGINTRFGVWGANLSAADYPPDTNTCYYNSTTATPFYSYQAYLNDLDALRQANQTYTPQTCLNKNPPPPNSNPKYCEETGPNQGSCLAGGGNNNDPFTRVDNRRTVVIPVGDCSTLTNGAGQLPLVDYLCLFLTQPVKQTGAAGERYVFAEIIDSGCIAGNGDYEPPSGGSNPGPTFETYRIILYEDPVESGSQDT